MWINTDDYCSDKQYKKIQETWVRHYQSELDKRSYYESSHVRFVRIQDLYRDGRMRKRLELMDFKQFQKRLTKNEYNYYYYKRWNHNRLRDHIKYNVHGPKHPVDYSEKKVLSEEQIAKREWRNKVKDPRDQKHGKNYRGAVSAFKYDNKRAHRAFEKHCINSNQTERLHQGTWKQMANWWSYD